MKDNSLPGIKEKGVRILKERTKREKKSKQSELKKVG